MARKRMFDLEIINQDSFLDLPMESKAIYFLLGMEADDEGFVAPKKVLRLYGGTEDSLRILIAKNFIIPFSTGVIVITDWKRNNWLDSRRIKNTIYQEEKTQITYNPTSEKYEYNGILPNAKQMLSENSIEENRVEESSIENNIVIPNGNDSITKSQLEEEFETIWKKYPNKKGKPNALKSYIKARKKSTSYEEVLTGLENYVQYITIGKIEPQYIKHGSTWFNQECWNDDYTIKERQNRPPIRREMMPEWYGKEIVAEKPSEEEIAELREMLKDFK